MFIVYINICACDSGIVTVGNNSLDYEAIPTFNLTIEVRDGGPNSGMVCEICSVHGR